MNTVNWTFHFTSNLKGHSINKDRNEPVERNRGDVHCIVLEMGVQNW